jgi:hypothetical protein
MEQGGNESTAARGAAGTSQLIVSFWGPYADAHRSPVCVLYLIRVKGEGKEVGLGRRKASVVKTTALGFFCFCFYLGVGPRSSLCVCV